MLATSSHAATADLTPPVVNLQLYEGTTDRVRVYRRDPVTLVKLSMAGMTAPSAVWKKTRGAAALVTLGATIDGDDVLVEISSFDKDQMSTKGVWQVDITDPALGVITLVTGSVLIEKEVGS